MLTSSLKVVVTGKPLSVANWNVGLGFPVPPNALTLVGTNIERVLTNFLTPHALLSRLP